MARRGIVTVGRKEDYPPSEWGSKDWQDVDPLPLDLVPIAEPRHTLPAGFSLRPKPDPEARSRRVDALLGRLGIRGHPTTGARPTLRH